MRAERAGLACSVEAWATFPHQPLTFQVGGGNQILTLEGPRVKEGHMMTLPLSPQKPHAQPYTSQTLEATVSISRCSKFRLQKQLLNQATSPLLETGPSTGNHKPLEEEERAEGEPLTS